MSIWKHITEVSDTWCWCMHVSRLYE